MLERSRLEQRRAVEGRLTIFFGAAPGVGKTYAMLEEARRLYGQGADVVVGYVEPHARAETVALTIGLEILPPRIVNYKGRGLAELDLDAMLARRPTIAVVDELAHTNPPESKFRKRHEDVKALLDAGIHVLTTLNVQHLESLSDVVSQITGVRVQETVPDSIFDDADEVKLVDVPPDTLLERLRQGRVYSSEVTQTAVEEFFRKGNLTALRELALRRTAQWVDRQMRSYREEHGIERVWPTHERLLVGVGAGVGSVSVLRAAKRLAVGLKADWIAVRVSTPRDLRQPASARERLLQNLKLAEELGAEVVHLSGSAVAESIVGYARDRNASKILVGRKRHLGGLDWIGGSIASDLLRLAEGIEVVVVQESESEPAPHVPRRSQPAPTWRPYGTSVAIVSVCTAVAALMSPRFDLTNIAMVYLLGVVIAAAVTGRLPAVVASVLSVAAFDFFFVPPRLTFAVADSQYLITFVVMLCVALTISTLMVRVRQQAEDALVRERRTAALYLVSRELSAARDRAQVLEIAMRHLSELLRLNITFLLPDSAGALTPPQLECATFSLEEIDQGAARWAFDRGQLSGAGTSTLPGSRALFLPLQTAHGRIGVLGVETRSAEPLPAHQLHLLETLSHQIALALERLRLLDESQDARVSMEAERLRAALLSTVSHDLRTPLSVIAGTASALLEEKPAVEASEQRRMLESIAEESARLNRLIDNLVFATRVESRSVVLQKDWVAVEDLVSSATRRFQERASDRPVRAYLPPDLPLVRADAILLEQVLINLLENALRHTPEGSLIEISAWSSGPSIFVKVQDEGPGLPPGEEHRVFDRFFTRVRRGTSPGLGLGLYICRGIIEAHGGRIWCENVPSGGAAFLFSIPRPEEPPAASETVGSL